MIEYEEGAKLTQADLEFPTADDGAQGVRFINKCVESSRKAAMWVEF